MAQPPRDVDPSRHSYTGSHFRQRLRNIVGTYVSAASKDIGDPGVQARMVEDSIAEQDRKVDAKDVGMAQGEEKLVLYPTYARTKPHLFHGHHRHPSTSQHGRPCFVPLTSVDVDLHVHGQVSIPHAANAPLRRKDRLLLSVARQICGLPPLPSPAGATTSPGVVKKASIDILQKMSGRSVPSTPRPQSPVERERNPLEQETMGELVDEPDLIDMHTPTDGKSMLSRSSTMSQLSQPSQPTLNHPVSFPASVVEKYSPPKRSNTVPLRPASSDSETTSPVKTNWRNSHNFPNIDLATCHANFMERLAPFLARSVAGRLVTIKVYAPPTSSSKDLDSREIIAQRQFLTNDYGHFTGRLVISPPQNATTPDTWTITATLSNLRNRTPHSVQEEVRFIPETGVSLISDFDDTVKHTSILSGARELFRNTFVRNLGDLYVEGVQEWYSSLINLGVQIHYVSNSPYQCWPIINSFMSAVGLPRGGSVLLKQYNGMISGMWENAADKKRASVDSIIRDFPGRTFILVGDSGEQDLELYTEMALAHREQIIGIFIRDVTTPLLSGSGNSTSSLSLPTFFEVNGQPTRSQGRMAQLKNLRGSWRTKSQEVTPTLSNPIPSKEDDDASSEMDRMMLKEIDLLSPLLMKAEDAGQGFNDDSESAVPLSVTSPPLPPRPVIHRTQSVSTISSTHSEPAGPPSPGRSLRVGTESPTTEDPSVRVKRVEVWKRRLARSREQLSMADSEVEIWTWRVGGDVEKICENLVKKQMEQKGEYSEKKMSLGA
jgi:phosphatidate phosphatase APP1